MKARTDGRVPVTFAGETRWLRPVAGVMGVHDRCNGRGCIHCDRTGEVELARYSCDRCGDVCDESLGSDEFPVLCDECAEAINRAEAIQIDDKMRREREGRAA